jgi:glutathione S-transferase
VTEPASPLRLYDLAGADPALRFSPYCWRIKLALAHKGLPFETVPWRFTEKDAIAFSGQGLVPVLVDGDRVVFDSWQIAAYLDEAYRERPTLLGRVIGRAHARFVKDWTERVVHPLILKLVILDILACLDPRDVAYFRQSREARFGTSLERVAVAPDEGIAALGNALAPVRATLEAQPYFGGERPTFPDFCLFGAFQWARCVSPLELLPDPADPVRRWRESLLDAYGGLARNATRVAP